MKLQSFKAFLNEVDNSYILAQSGVDSKGIDNKVTRDLLNSRLRMITKDNFLTPYMALGAVSKVLAYGSIVIPQYVFMDKEQGEVVFKANHAGQKVFGPDIHGDHESPKNEGDQYFVYFSYDLKDDGFYEVHAQVVDTEELEEILGIDIDGDDEVGEDAVHTGLALRNEESKKKLDESRGPLEGHPYHHKSDAALHYIIKDAGEAAKAMQGHAPHAEAKYLDQVNDASTVLHHRKKTGTGPLPKPVNESLDESTYHGDGYTSHKIQGGYKLRHAKHGDVGETESKYPHYDVISHNYNAGMERHTSHQAAIKHLIKAHKEGLMESLGGQGNRPHPGVSRPSDPKHWKNTYQNDVHVYHPDHGTHLGSYGKLANGKYRSYPHSTNAQHVHDTEADAIAHLHREAGIKEESLDEKHLGFAKLKGELSHEKGIKNPGALAAVIGRKKYGKKKFQAAAAHHHAVNEEPSDVATEDRPALVKIKDKQSVVLKALQDRKNSAEVMAMTTEEPLDEVAPPGLENMVLALKKQFPAGSKAPFAISWKHFREIHPEYKPKT